MHIILDNIQQLSKHIFNKDSLIYLEASNNKISAVSKNHDFILYEDLDGSVVKEGSLTCNAFILFNYVKNIRKSIDIKLTNNHVIVDKLTIPVSTSNYVRVIKQEYQSFSLDALILSNILISMRKLVSEKINGILCTHDTERLCFVATDLYRITRIILQEIFVSKLVYFVIPIHTINEIVKLTKLTKSVTVSYANNLMIEFNNTKLYSSLLSAKFPIYNDLFNGYSMCIEVNGLILQDIVSRISVIANNKLIIHIKHNTIEFEGKSALGTALESIEIEYTSDPITFTLHAEHFIQSLLSSNIAISFNPTNLKYILIHAEENHIIYDTVLMLTESA